MGRIYLIGYMASGKSTVAKKLATAIGLQFIDMDELITERADMSIPDIFQKYGESAFRQLEASALYQCSKMSDVVIATGGGAPCFHDNIKLMNDTGTSIYLELGNNIIVTRLEGQRASRPLVASKTSDELITYVNVHLSTRRDYYEMAHHKVDASQTPDDIVVQITRLIES